MGVLYTENVIAQGDSGGLLSGLAAEGVEWRGRVSVNEAHRLKLREVPQGLVVVVGSV